MITKRKKIPQLFTPRQGKRNLNWKIGEKEPRLFCRYFVLDRNRFQTKQ